MRTLATLLLLAMMLTGCAQQQPPEETPPPTLAPMLATDEEALAAAEEAYAAYLAMSDLIASEGGADPERIAPYVTADWLVRELEGSKALQLSGLTIAGSSDLRSISLQQHDSRDLIVYACLDVSGSRVLDASGADITDDDRVEHVEMQVSFIEGLGKFRLSDNEPFRAAKRC